MYHYVICQFEVIWQSQVFELRPRFNGADQGWGLLKFHSLISVLWRFMMSHTCSSRLQIKFMLDESLKNEAAINLQRHLSNIHWYPIDNRCFDDEEITKWKILLFNLTFYLYLVYLQWLVNPVGNSGHGWVHTAIYKLIRNMWQLSKIGFNFKVCECEFINFITTGTILTTKTSFVWL